MKRLILILMLSGLVPAFGETYTEFYINNAGGDNMNSGHTPEATATFSTTGCDWVNNTSATVGTISKIGLGAAATAVTNGAFASIFPDGTTGATPYVGMVVTNDATTDSIQISLVNKGGTKPASSTAGTSINVGGAWKGPGTYDGLAAHPETNTFPMALINGAMTNAPSRTTCVNIKSGTTYSVTNAIAVLNSGGFPLVIAGYTTSVRDGGRATIDGGVVYPGYVLVVFSGTYIVVRDMIFSHNGSSASTPTYGVNSSGVGNSFYRCIFHDLRGHGISMTSQGSVLECEAYNCNLANAADAGGLRVSASYAKNCISHDNNAGANCIGIVFGGGSIIEGCISYNNSGHGIEQNYSGQLSISSLIGCDVYSNALAGLEIKNTTAMPLEIRNCNFLRNKGMAITNSSTVPHFGHILNCGFGTGTMTNGYGEVASSLSLAISGSVMYAANQTPWTDPTNGNFSIALAAAKSAGYSYFPQSTVNSPTNTTSFPDIGAGQASDTNSVSGEHSHVFAQ